MEYLPNNGSNLGRREMKMVDNLWIWESFFALKTKESKSFLFLRTIGHEKEPKRKEILPCTPTFILLPQQIMQNFKFTLLFDFTPTIVNLIVLEMFSRML